MSSLSFINHTLNCQYNERTLALRVKSSKPCYAVKCWKDTFSTEYVLEGASRHANTHQTSHMFMLLQIPRSNNLVDTHGLILVLTFLFLWLLLLLSSLLFLLFVFCRLLCIVLFFVDYYFVFRFSCCMFSFFVSSFLVFSLFNLCFLWFSNVLFAFSSRPLFVPSKFPCPLHDGPAGSTLSNYAARSHPRDDTWFLAERRYLRF